LARMTLRDLWIAAAACCLWFGLVSVGTYVTLRYTPAGQLMIDLGRAGGDRSAVEAAVAGYDDPFALLTETVPLLLRVVAVCATIAAGIFVGAFAAGRSLWPPAVAATALLSLLGFVDPASVMNWLRAGAVAVILWASGFVVMRWRLRRSR